MGILRTRKHEIAYRLMAGIPDAVFAVSEQVRRHCIEVDRINPARVQTIYNGLSLADWDMGPKPSKTPGRVRITTVGNIRRVKGHDVFIRAAAEVVRRSPGVSFSIAGDVLEPAYFAELQSLVQDLNLSDHFHFIGGAVDLHRHLSEVDIFVLPSRSEGFSNAIVEAMAASLPVIATLVGGNAEAIENGETGLLVPPEDPEALAKAILQLLSDPNEAKRMGMAGRALAFKSFTVESMMNQVTEAYKRLLSTGRSPANVI